MAGAYVATHELQTFKIIFHSLHSKYMGNGPKISTTTLLRLPYNPCKCTISTMQMMLSVFNTFVGEDMKIYPVL